MLGWNSGRLALVSFCAAALLPAGTVYAQEVLEGPARPSLGSPTDGAIVPYPPRLPGAVDVPQSGQHGPLREELVRPSDYWLGLQCAAARPELRAQLGMAEGEGLLVEAVVENAPAARAGIQKHDVLIRAGDRKLARVRDLVDTVDAVKEGNLEITLIRGGKKREIEVSPEKRPVPQSADSDQGTLPEEWRQFYDYMKDWEPGKDGRPAMRFRFWHPGAWIAGNGAAALPDDVKIEIIRQGQRPAQIKVTRGEETWQVTEHELDQLPDDLRPHVERMLGIPAELGRMLLPPDALHPAASPDRQGRLEMRLEELNQQIEQLRESMLGIRGSKSPDLAKPKAGTDPSAVPPGGRKTG